MIIEKKVVQIMILTSSLNDEISALYVNGTRVMNSLNEVDSASLLAVANSLSAATNVCLTKLSLRISFSGRWESLESDLKKEGILYWPLELSDGEKYKVWVPKSFNSSICGIAPGSAIVSNNEIDDGYVTCYYEGNIYVSDDLLDYEAKLLHASVSIDNKESYLQKCITLKMSIFNGGMRPASEYKPYSMILYCLK